jgi:hemerythrin-like domain-containing protein
MKDSRRGFLCSAALGAAGLVPWAGPASGADEKKGEEPEISAPEDLMREHGVLNRVLLVYEEGLRRLRRKKEVSPKVFHRAASLVRKFVEEYHEKLEEKFLFPEFERRKKLVGLVKTLRKQHDAGRALTETILRNSDADAFGKEEARAELARACVAFIRMYRPHEAREDTVLFPALYTVMPAKRVRELGEHFEKEEDRVLGEKGFEKTVAQVAEIEKELGIYDLDKFTPKGK